MAIEHVVAGPVAVSFAGTALGFTRDGVDIRYDPRWGDIFSDDFGGAGGAPADTQLLGATASVTCEFTKYDAAEVEKLNSWITGGVAGKLPDFGTLIRQNAKTATLLLAGSLKIYTFLTAFPREPQPVNVGTKFSTYLVQFECWVTSAADRTIVSVT